MSAIQIQKPDIKIQQEVIAGIIDAVGRPVLLTLQASQEICPTCGDDVDPFCPTCNGNGVIRVETTMVYNAEIRWAISDTKLYTPMGQAVDGDCSIIIATNTIIDDILNKIVTVKVDNRICSVKNWAYSGLSEITHVYLNLIEIENTGGYRVS